MHVVFLPFLVSPRQRPSISPSPENLSAPFGGLWGGQSLGCREYRWYLECLAASQMDIQPVLMFHCPPPSSRGPRLPITEVWAGGRGICSSASPPPA